jgi:hypothetical protein
MSAEGARVRPRLALPVAAISLSAFLLFSLELYAGRVVLPVFGGSPAVWTTALCFFTGVVFLGYLWSHLLVTRLPWRVARLVQLALVAAALASVAFAPRDLVPLRLTTLPPAVNVLVVLGAIVGVPAFLLSTTTPLVSARFAARGDDPWWLYAASNAASLGGLLAYPLLIEPRVPLSVQRLGSTALLGVLAALLGWLLLADRPSAVVAVPEPRPEPLSRARQLLWLFAACMPAGLLSATTTRLAVDHASAPLLWIGPLGVYLGSFVIAFSERGRRMLPLAQRLVPAAATLLWIVYVARVDWPVLVLVPLLLGSYGVIAVAIHGRLAEDRPAEAHLRASTCGCRPAGCSPPALSRSRRPCSSTTCTSTRCCWWAGSSHSRCCSPAQLAAPASPAPPLARPLRASCRYSPWPCRCSRSWPPRRVRARPSSGCCSYSAPSPSCSARQHARSP